MRIPFLSSTFDPPRLLANWTLQSLSRPSRAREPFLFLFPFLLSLSLPLSKPSAVSLAWSNLVAPQDIVVVWPASGRKLSSPPTGPLLTRTVPPFSPTVFHRTIAFPRALNTGRWLLACSQPSSPPPIFGGGKPCSHTSSAAWDFRVLTESWMPKILGVSDFVLLHFTSLDYPSLE